MAEPTARELMQVVYALCVSSSKGSGCQPLPFSSISPSAQLDFKKAQAGITLI